MFKLWPKILGLEKKRKPVFTEKIDGTNACVIVVTKAVPGWMKPESAVIYEPDRIHALKLFGINKMNLEEKLAICKARLEGKTLERSRKNKNIWEVVSPITETSGMFLNFSLYDYKVKETPKPSIAYCYKMESSGHLIWSTKLIDTEDTVCKRYPKFDIISKEEE